MREHDPRKYAEECLRQAEEAFSEADQLMFIDMASCWLWIAERDEIIAALTSAARQASVQREFG
jgi:hypothetical protein